MKLLGTHFEKSLLAPNNILYIFTCIQSTYNYLCDFRRYIHCAMIKVQSQSQVVGVFKLEMMHQQPTADHLDISPPSPAPPSSIVPEPTHTHHITIDCPTNSADHAQPLVSPSQSHHQPTPPCQIRLPPWPGNGPPIPPTLCLNTTKPHHLPRQTPLSGELIGDEHLPTLPPKPPNTRPTHTH